MTEGHETNIARNCDRLALGPRARKLRDETHEAPGLGPSGREPLVAGDVLAVEPGTGRHGVGAARVEDLYLVLEDGVELLTPFPHELDPRVGAGA